MLTSKISPMTPLPEQHKRWNNIFNVPSLTNDFTKRGFGDLLWVLKVEIKTQFVTILYPASKEWLITRGFSRIPLRWSSLYGEKFARTWKRAAAGVSMCLLLPVAEDRLMWQAQLDVDVNSGTQVVLVADTCYVKKLFWYGWLWHNLLLFRHIVHFESATSVKSVSWVYSLTIKSNPIPLSQRPHKTWLWSRKHHTWLLKI